MSQLAKIQPLEDLALDPAVRGFLHIPEQANGNGLVLTHGAGANAQAPLLRALSDLFADAGYHVLRCNLPYRQLRSFGPPRPGDAARDRSGLANALGVLRKSVAGRLFLGGHSYGGRQSTMLAADNPGVVEGLLLLSYPLHPPRQKEQLRIQHLPRLSIPALFVHGTRDPFGSMEEMEAALKLIPARTRLERVEGAGHDLGFKGKGAAQKLPERIRQAFQELFR